MIFTLLFSPIAYVLSLIFGAFPVVTISSNITTSLATATSSLFSLSSFIPVSTLGTVVAIYVAVELAILYFKFLRFIASFIPFFGGRGV